MDEASIVRSLATTLVLFVLVTAVALPVVVSRLRRHHPEVWEALGTADRGSGEKAPGVWRLLGFTLSPRHLRLDDLTLSLACVALALAILAVIAGLIGWLLQTLHAG